MVAGHRILEELRRAQVLVLHPRDEDGTGLLEHLRRLGCEVKLAWPLPTALPPNVDTIFVLIDDVHVDRLAELIEQQHPAVIAVASYESPTSLKAISDLNAHGVLNKPLRPLGILTQFALARYRHSYEARLAGKVQKLEETLKGRRLVERGVKLLAQMNGIDEEAAYRSLRDQATARRCSMASLAELIIAAHETTQSFGLSISSTPPRQ